MQHGNAMKMLYGIAGTLSLFVGIFFLLIPILPTVPFLVLAAICFSKVSQSFYRRLITLPYVGKFFVTSDPASSKRMVRLALMIMAVMSGLGILVGLGIWYGRG